MTSSILIPSRLRDLRSRVLHLLTVDHRRALDAIVWRMKGTDDIFDEAHEVVKAPPDIRPDARQMIEAVDTVTILLTDYKSNLRALIAMCQIYEAGRFASIATGDFRPVDQTRMSGSGQPGP